MIRILAAALGALCLSTPAFAQVSAQNDALFYFEVPLGASWRQHPPALGFRLRAAQAFAPPVIDLRWTAKEPELRIVGFAAGPEAPAMAMSWWIAGGVGVGAMAMARSGHGSSQQHSQQGGQCAQGSGMGSGQPASAPGQPGSGC